MNKVLTVIILCLVMLASACGHDESFIITGKVEDVPTMNLRIVYYVNGKVLTGVTAATDGNFMYEGRTSDKSLIEIYDNDYRLLGRVVAMPGEDIVLTLNRAEPYTIKASGNDISSRWAAFLNENAEALSSTRAAEHNAPIAEYIRANPTDELSAYLLMSQYDSSSAEPIPADSLWNLIDETARPKDIAAAFLMQMGRVASATANRPIINIPYIVSGNDAEIFKPSEQKLTFIAFSDDFSGRDSTITVLRDLDSRRKSKRFEMLDLSVDSDTITWRRSVRNDSAEWIQGWVAGSISGQAISKLGVPTIPYYIVADSTGNQLWRGHSASEAKSFVIEQLSNL